LEGHSGRKYSKICFFNWCRRPSTFLRKRNVSWLAKPDPWLKWYVWVAFVLDMQVSSRIRFPTVPLAHILINLALSHIRDHDCPIFTVTFSIIPPFLLTSVGFSTQTFHLSLPGVFPSSHRALPSFPFVSSLCSMGTSSDPTFRLTLFFC
jgi:hypothetical protein